MNKPTPMYIKLAHMFNICDYWVVDYDYCPEHVKEELKYEFFNEDAWN